MVACLFINQRKSFDIYTFCQLLGSIVMCVFPIDYFDSPHIIVTISDSVLSAFVVIIVTIILINNTKNYNNIAQNHHKNNLTEK